MRKGVEIEEDWRLVSVHCSRQQANKYRLDVATTKTFKPYFDFIFIIITE
jgi:hypothetical protein